MFGLGMGELLVILAIALLFLGPKKLPDLASTLGKAIRSFRKATSDLSSQLDVDESVKQPLRELKAALRDEPAPLPFATQATPPESTVSQKPAEPAVEPPALEPTAKAEKA
jgi:sec-independent protein translocase protein TatB